MTANELLNDVSTHLRIVAIAGIAAIVVKVVGRLLFSAWLGRRRGRGDDADKLYASGQAASRQGQWKEAMAHLDAAHWLAPERADIAAALGYAAFKAGNLRLALPALQYARNYFPRNRRLLETLLAIAGRIDSPALEKAVFADLMRLDPKRYHRKVVVEKN